MARRRRKSHVHGVLVIDKPAGPTSHDVVSTVRRALSERRIGHAGTLDPPATGVLVLLLGCGTRLQRYILGADKAYSFELVLGRATDTLDASGSTTATSPSPELELDALEGACARLHGEIALVPPMVSAIHHEGRRLHELARAGETVERAPRACRIDRLTATGDPYRDADGLLRVAMVTECSSGTYVRSIGETLGQMLGIPSCIDRLRRTRVGRWGIARAIPLDQVTDASVVAPLEEAVAHLPAAQLDAVQEQAFIHGNPIQLGEPPEGIVRVHGVEGFLGVGEVAGDMLAPKTVVVEQG